MTGGDLALVIGAIFGGIVTLIGAIVGAYIKLKTFMAEQLAANDNAARQRGIPVIAKINELVGHTNGLVEEIRRNAITITRDQEANANRIGETTVGNAIASMPPRIMPITPTPVVVPGGLAADGTDVKT